MTNFTMVENEIINFNLSGQAFKLYFLLKSYCFSDKTTCFPSQKVLADRLNKSVRTVQRALKELAACGLINIIRRGSMSNIYELDKPSNKLKDSQKKNGNIHDEINSLINESRSTNEKDEKYYNHKNTYNKYNNWRNKKDTFNDYSQRNYNFNKLEDMLLGYASVPEDFSEILE